MEWKNMSPMQKITMVIGAIAVVLIVITLIKPQLFPIDTTCPAIAVFTICEAVLYWEEKRKLAYFMIIAAVISMVCFALDLLFL